jgi:hypothetical protein
MSIINECLLVELNISSWSGRKLDRKVSAEVNADKSASRDAARVNKNLFAGSDRLEKINNLVSATRSEFYHMTPPWSASGLRVLPFSKSFDFIEWVGKKEQEFKTEVDQFLTEYRNLISAQAFRLGAMFNASEYPPVSELQDKFKFAYVISPMPTSGDFRIDAQNHMAESLRAQYDKAYKDRIESAMADTWSRLFEVVSHLKDKCGPETKVFRESTLDNAQELCGLLSHLNITGDRQLEARRAELEQALLGISIEGLRKDEAVKQDVSAKMQSILDKMDSFV